MLQKTAILIFTLLLAGAAQAQNRDTYTVQRGDNLFRISQKHGMSLQELKDLNGLRSNVIRPGQELLIDKTSSRRISSRGDEFSDLEAGNERVEGPRTYYKVRRGDNIYSIASEFGVLVDEIREWNGISQVSTGQTIIVGKSDVARVPAYKPAVEEDAYDYELYRKASARRTSSKSNRSRADIYDRNENRRSTRERYYDDESNRRRSSSRRVYDDFDREREDWDNKRKKEDRYYDDDEEDNRRSSNSYRRYEDNGRNSGSSSRRTSQSRYEEDEPFKSRRIRARDIKYGGSNVETFYEYVDDDLENSTSFSSDRERSINRRTANNNLSGNFTGEFTELSSKKARKNRFYAFHNTLPIGSRIKMQIPQNAGYVEVEIIDKLPSYERVMIGLSPACVAVLEGAGTQPHSVTIIAE